MDEALLTDWLLFEYEVKNYMMNNKTKGENRRKFHKILVDIDIILEWIYEN